jgi:glutamine synthetase
MATLRFEALSKAMSRKPIEPTAPHVKTSEYYGVNVFDKEKMQKYLSKEAFQAVMAAVEKNERIDRKFSDAIAAGMKAWAIEKGATHYTHWFQPLTGGTAEKHDAFADPQGNGKVIEAFSGKLLAQQEPDASSFPSGGIRATFEARGYTAWDPSSPAFVLEDTLCIPTIFVSYTGEVLDYKAPLLKSLAILDKAAVDVCHYFDKDVTKVNANLGWEQEYFLIDEALYEARPDLVLTERTLMGHESSKNQQLEDQYFGAIPPRIQSCMKEIEFEAWKLGIPLKTRHNEVAPNQYELAPVYEEANLAVDHNLLIMTIMRNVARKHDFACLLHEKPFAGINGSGKHNNWSVSTDTGVNLLSPGKNPKSNMQFLTYLVNTLMAVYKNAPVLKASIFSANNAHRLGANEAPPAIISAFLGSYLNKMLDQLEEKVTDQKMTPDEKTEIKLDIGRIPEILLDNTDRNRTSPFAFTGNRFEFRAVGSSANCSEAMTSLNTALAAQLLEFKKDVDAIIEKGVKKDEAILQVLRKLIKECKAIRFDGNGYSDEWKDEAKKRGLDTEANPVKVFESYLSKESINLFKKTGVLSERELHARTEIKWETYIKKVQIEARVLGDLALNHIVPVAIEYQTNLIKNVQGIKDLFGEKDYKDLAAARLELIKEVGSHITTIKNMVKDMVEARKVANKIEDVHKKALAYSEKIFPMFEEIRYHIDKLELVVDNEMWTLPKYREMLFIR